MKTLRSTVLLSLVVLLMASCTAMPPIMPGPGTTTSPIEQRAIATEPNGPAATALPPTVESAGAVSPTVALEATEPVTGTAEAATPTAEQVMGANPLTGVVWEWAALIKTNPASQSVVSDPAAYTVIFGEDGQALIQADCNTARATYLLEEDGLTITLGATTKVACTPGSLSEQMLTLLSQVGSYMIDAGDLVLRHAETGDTMLFRNGGPALEGAPAPAVETPAGGVRAATQAPTAAAVEMTPTATSAPATAAPAATVPAPGVAGASPTPAAERSTGEAPKLVGTTWQWEQLINVATGKSTVQVGKPENYTVLFAADGTAAMKADCNRAGGSYKVDGNKLTVEVGPVTLAACGTGSLTDAFLINLTSAAGYTIENSKLNVELMADGGRMVFGAAK